MDKENKWLISFRAIEGKAPCYSIRCVEYNFIFERGDTVSLLYEEFFGDEIITKSIVFNSRNHFVVIEPYKD